jgi:soluble lytic murein transglycosylase
MAVPRVHLPAGSSGVGLPQPLPPSEAARIRRIFALQREGAIPAAIAETGRLTDTSLLGHILADRLLAHPARSAASALSDWLGRYADLPDAHAIYSLLVKRLPAGARLPAAPVSASLASARGGAPDAPASAASGAASSARDALSRGHDAAALRLGRAAYAQSRGRDGEAAFVAGLAAWRRGGYEVSAALFEGASLAEAAGASLRASAAFWAGRAHLRSGDTQAWHAWTVRAAAEPHTLYGMIARRTLGLGPAASPPSPTLAEADVDAVAATPQGHRAFALLQVGEPARAEAELRQLWAAAQADAPLSRALFLVAATSGLSQLVSDLSDVVGAVADLPVPRLRPRGGFRLDRALVYAVAHVESNFDAAAVSGAGAHGMMQLMPETAGMTGSLVSVSGLQDAGQNLQIGQAYLAYLAQPAIAGDDLLRVLASYNAGPNAVQRWALPSDTDPLMFLEIIPVGETRQFVQRALTNLWSYADRFGMQTPSLDAMAAGVWPPFSQETGAVPRSRFQQAVVRLH